MVNFNGTHRSIFVTNKTVLARIFLDTLGQRIEDEDYFFQKIPGLGRVYHLRNLLEDEVLTMLRNLENPCFQSPLQNGARYVVANINQKRITEVRTRLNGEMHTLRDRGEINYFLANAFPGIKEEEVDLNDILYSESG